jgi:hypothetical protein
MYLTSIVCRAHQSSNVWAVSSGPLSTRITAGRPAVDLDQRFYHAHDTRARDRSADLDREPLPISFVEHVERPEATTAVERVVHDVERPGAVAHHRRRQRFTEPLWDPSFGSARHVKLEFADSTACQAASHVMPGQDSTACRAVDRRAILTRFGV